MWLAALRTAAAGLIVSLYVLVCGPPVLLWAVASGRRQLLYATAAAGVRLGFAIVGIAVRLVGEEHIRPGPVVYACNHSSNVDSPAVFIALRRLFPKVRVLYKAELRRLPVLVWAFDVAGFVPLERSNQAQSRPAIERAAEALRQGNAFFIFPEGTRSRTGELLPFKMGGFVMALKAQAPIVPVAVTGGRAAMRKGASVVWPAAVRVTFLPAISTAGLTFEDRHQLVGDVRAAIGAALATDMRQGVVT
jgi:1-acyl-sn-glycerol-3-phosphate acyltransferase